MAVTKSNDKEVQQQLADHSKVMIKFYADWCGSCKLMAPKYKRISEDERFADVLFLDINAEENPNIRKQVGVSNLPFFAAYRDGKLVEADFTARDTAVEKMAENLVQA